MNSDNASLRPAFQYTIKQCRKLYVRGARECLRSTPHLIPGDPAEFVERMHDLHRGLLLKVFMSVGFADHEWSAAERELAQDLFRHLWNKELDDAGLRKAIEHVGPEVRDVSWLSLLRPFVVMEPLKQKVSALETVLMRNANILAKADGRVTPREVACLRSLQREVKQVLSGRAGSTQQARGDQDRESARRAIEQMKNEGHVLHEELLLEDPDDDAPPQEPAPDRPTREEALAELDALIGIEHVKKEVRSLVNLLQLHEHRREAGLPETTMSRHLIFTGNPGTGKTTVARILARIYAAMGMLDEGHLVETDRSGLVAEFAGQTSPRTHERIDEAMGGVLFIDEAYSLVSPGSEDPYGREAVQALLKRMEDDRDRLVVIAAGYPGPMKELLRTNPGLKSRFGQTVHFDDYRPREMGLIFDAFSREHHYEVPGLVQARIMIGLEWCYENRDEHFGNGRLVRNLFERSVRNLADRVVGVAPITREVLTQFDVADIQFDHVNESHWADWEKRIFRTQCEGCGREAQVRAEHLDQKFRCPQCNADLAARWAEPLARTE